VANLEANIPERPEFLDFIALNDLSPMNNIEQLACEIAEFMSDDVPQGRVFEACWLSGPVSDQVAFGQIFDRDGRLRHPIWSATLSLCHLPKLVTPNSEWMSIRAGERRSRSSLQ
jgi:hypothetical protein